MKKIIMAVAFCAVLGGAARLYADSDAGTGLADDCLRGDQDSCRKLYWYHYILPQLVKEIIVIDYNEPLPDPSPIEYLRVHEKLRNEEVIFKNPVLTKGVLEAVAKLHDVLDRATAGLRKDALYKAQRR